MAIVIKNSRIIAGGYYKHPITKPNGHVILKWRVLLKIAEQLVEVIIDINQTQHSRIYLIWVECIFVCIFL